MADDKQESGVNITGSGISIGGDVVGRDKITSTGIKGDEVAKLFEQLTSTVKASAPPDKLAEAQQKIADLEAAVKSKTPDVGLVGKSLKWLKKNVPGVSDVLKLVLNQPIVGQAVKDIAAVVLDEE